MSAGPEIHEHSDAPPRVAILLAAAVAAGLGLALFVAWRIFAAATPAGAPRLGPAGLFAHGPAERTAIEEDWPKLDAEVHAHLAGYGWVDRPAGVVRIPIEQAMERLAAEQGRVP